MIHLQIKKKDGVKEQVYYSVDNKRIEATNSYKEHKMEDFLYDLIKDHKDLDIKVFNDKKISVTEEYVNGWEDLKKAKASTDTAQIAAPDNTAGSGETTATDNTAGNVDGGANNKAPQSNPSVQNNNAGNQGNNGQGQSHGQGRGRGKKTTKPE